MNTTLLTLEEAAKRYPLPNFTLFDDLRQHRNKWVEIFDNELIINDLNLGYSQNKNVVAYVFTENLTVVGNIYTEELDLGIALVALKNVAAKNVAVGGQEVYIVGNLAVEGLLCGAYNQGSMTVRGDVKAQYILNDDYVFLFEKKVEAIVLNDIKSGYHKINNWKESLDNATYIAPSNLEYWDILTPEIYDVYHDCFDFTALVRLLKKGGELFVDNPKKLEQLNFTPQILTDLFHQLNLNIEHNRFDFGLGFRLIDIRFQFYRQQDETYFLDIQLEKERFKYKLERNELTINHLTVNGLSKFLTIENDVKNYYRAAAILLKSKTIIHEFTDKKNKLLAATQQVIAPVFPNEFPFIYQSLQQVYEDPIRYYNDNRAFFEGLKIDYLDWSFQKQAVLNILQQSDIALVFSGKEYISTALNDLENWFKKRDFDIKTDWKARGLYLKRRIEYFSKDVLIVNDICQERNIPIHIKDISLWLNERFIVFFPINSIDNEVFTHWLIDLGLEN
jgi:hypothetical protein